MYPCHGYQIKNIQITQQKQSEQNWAKEDDQLKGVICNNDTECSEGVLQSKSHNIGGSRLRPLPCCHVADTEQTVGRGQHVISGNPGRGICQLRNSEHTAPLNRDILQKHEWYWWLNGKQIVKQNTATLYKTSSSFDFLGLDLQRNGRNVTRGYPMSRSHHRTWRLSSSCIKIVVFNGRCLFVNNPPSHNRSSKNRNWKNKNCTGGKNNSARNASKGSNVNGPADGW